MTDHSRARSSASIILRKCFAPPCAPSNKNTKLKESPAEARQGLDDSDRVRGRGRSGSATDSLHGSRIRAATSPASQALISVISGKWVQLLKDVAPRTE